MAGGPGLPVDDVDDDLDPRDVFVELRHQQRVDELLSAGGEIQTPIDD